MTKLPNTTVSYKIGNNTYESMTDDDGVALLHVALPPGIYTVEIINPVNNKQTNVTLTIKADTTDKRSYPHIASHNGYDKDVKQNTYKKNTRDEIRLFHKIIHNDKIIYEGNYMMLATLNNIFNQKFINGHLVVFIDGQVVFNDSVTDNISLVIFEIIEKFLGKHSIKVEFTDKNNNTRSFEEIIIIK